MIKKAPQIGEVKVVRKFAWSETKTDDGYIVRWRYYYELWEYEKFSGPVYIGYRLLADNLPQVGWRIKKRSSVKLYHTHDGLPGLPKFVGPPPPPVKPKDPTTDNVPEKVFHG